MPYRRIATAEDRPSGTFEIATAAMNARLGTPPCSSVIPIAADSGTPSSSAPSASTVPDAASSRPEPDDILRLPAPRRETTRSPTKNARLPSAIPTTVCPSVPDFADSPISSYATDAISTPAPPAMTVALTRRGSRKKLPTSAPTTSVDPPTMPHHSASSTTAILSHPGAGSCPPRRAPGW